MPFPAFPRLIASEADRQFLGRVSHPQGEVRLRGARKARRNNAWTAGFLREPAPDSWFERLHALGQPMLVVLDYAEGRSDLSSVLAPLLRYRRYPGGEQRQRVRLLLLTRGTGDWWDALRSTDPDLASFLEETPPYVLPPVAKDDNMMERETVFREAALAFAGVRMKPPVERSPVPLDAPIFDRMLYLHMAALAAVEGLAFSATSLIDEILDHEERFWEQRATLGRRDDLATQVRRSQTRCVIAAATLRGGLSGDAIPALVHRILDVADPVLPTFLRNIYKAQQDTGAIPPLEPDLLGEAMVLRTLRRASERPGNYLERVFGDNERASLRAGFERLGWLSAEHPEEMTSWIQGFLEAELPSRASPALDAAKALGTRTLTSRLGDCLADTLERHGDVALARALAEETPVGTVSLARVFAWANETLLREASHLKPDERAELLLRVAKGRLDIGQTQAATTAAREAAELARSLALADPQQGGAAMATLLATVGHILSAAGEHAEALEAGQEAVKRLREFAKKDPACTNDLALALNNLGSRLWRCGQYEEALRISQEAVAQLDEIERRTPGEHTDALVAALNNLGARLKECGRGREAVSTLRQALGLARKLAEENPDKYLRFLAKCHCTLGVLLQIAGDKEGALKQIDKAIDTRRLFAKRSTAFLIENATSLHNRAALLFDMSRPEEALDGMREALDVAREASRHNPKGAREILAQILVGMGIAAMEMDQLGQAVEATREGVALYRDLAKESASKFQPSLTDASLALAHMLGRTGLVVEALEAAQDAVGIYRSLAKEAPERFGEDLKVREQLLLKLAGRLPVPATSGEPTPFRAEARPGPNDPCTCGSGRKYKRCCMGKP